MEKVLLVVGGSSDIGVATVRDQVAAFDKIIIHYNHLNDSIAELQEKYKNIECLQADLESIDSTQKLISAINEQNIVPTHILHLPAMKFEAKKFHKTPWDIIEKEINVSLRSAIMILREYLPKMSKNRFGKIVIMLSMVINSMPPKYNADYVIVKEALYGLVKAIAVEYADQGISINGISPALVETKFVEKMHDYLKEENAKLSPVGRNLVVEDVIPTIRFLLSDESNLINGQNISVTGGR